LKAENQFLMFKKLIFCPFSCPLDSAARGGRTTRPPSLIHVSGSDLLVGTLLRMPKFLSWNLGLNVEYKKTF
jgi:hypothetical protein